MLKYGVGKFLNDNFSRKKTKKTQRFVSDRTYWFVYIKARKRTPN